MPTKVVQWDQTETHTAQVSRIDVAIKRDGNGDIIDRYLIVHMDDVLPQEKIRYEDMQAADQAMFRNFWRAFGENGLAAAAAKDPDLSVGEIPDEDEFD